MDDRKLCTLRMEFLSKISRTHSRCRSLEEKSPALVQIEPEWPKQTWNHNMVTDRDYLSILLLDILYHD